MKNLFIEKVENGYVVRETGMYQNGTVPMGQAPYTFDKNWCFTTLKDLQEFITNNFKVKNNG